MRLDLALLALALLLVGTVAAWSLQQDTRGESAEYAVTAIAREGAIIDARVRVDEATALRALQAAARDAGLRLALEEYPGMGTYVRAIGEHRAEGPAGWIYEVHRGGAWVSGDRSAAHFPLQKGDALRWSWTAG